MERFRARLAGRGIDFSFGVATYERGGRASIDKLIDAADRAMYAQKQGKKRRSDPAARG